MSTYSGEISNGLNINASYDRMYYYNVIETFEDVVDKWNYVSKLFDDSKRTRLVFNVLIKTTDKQKILDNRDLFLPGDIEAFFDHQKGTKYEGYSTLMLGINKKIRMISSKHIESIKQKVSDTIQNNLDMCEKNLDKTQYLIKKGYVFDCCPNQEDLGILWSQTFGWTQDAIQKEISQKLNFILTLKSPQGEVISGGMISSSGESTEWSTHSKYQRQGFIVPLLFVLHAYFLKNFDNGDAPLITSEARFDRSVKPGLLSGMEVQKIDDDIGIHLNHVTIGGDESDYWNAGKGLINGIKFCNLRSFVSMKLKKEYYDKNLIDTILKTANL